MTLLRDEQALAQQCKQGLAGKLAVLYGGWSSEREVSLMSGAAVLQALQNAGLDVIGLDVNRDIASELGAHEVTHVFNALHGPIGEDGVISGMLELLGVGSTGSGVLASALAMDKVRSKHLWRGLGIATPAYCEVDDPNAVDAAAMLAELGGKAMVKPSREGSSIGMAIASNANELREAIALAASYDKSVLVEQYIAGPEYSVPVVGDEVLPVVQLLPASEFYDYEAKYVADTTRYDCPAPISEQQQRRASELSQQAYRSLGCSGWGRVDLLQDESGELFVLEVNTIPGMTSHSILPMSAAVAGLSFEAVVLNVLLDSLSVEATDAR